MNNITHEMLVDPLKHKKKSEIISLIYFKPIAVFQNVV